MNKMCIGKMFIHRTVTMFLLLLALAGCIVPPPPTGAPGTTPGSTPPPATDPLTDTQSLPAGDLPAGGGDEMAERVDFPPGATAVTLSGTLADGSDQEYALAASVGQTFEVQTVGASAPVSFTVYGPAGTTWPGEPQADAVNTMATTVDTPEHGDYLVTLTAPADETTTPYTVTFTVDLSASPVGPVDRVQFPAGETVAERSGMLPAGEAGQQFLLSGNAGWTMTVDATSDAAPLSMTIEDPSGMHWIPEMRPTDSGYTIGQQFTLPERGYYLVTLQKADQTPNTNYTITFTLDYGS